MKKIKFLSIAAMVAFMALGLSSCEKEDFRTNLTVNVDAAPAVVYIQPTVIAFVNGVAKDVTAEAEFNEYIIPEANEEGKITAQSIDIIAYYTATDDKFGLTTELQGKITINVPELSRGMSRTFTPTIVLSAQTSSTNLNEVPGTTEDYTITPKTISVKNYNKFYYTDVNIEYQVKKGTEVTNIDWKSDYDSEIERAINEFNTVKTETIKKSDIKVLGESQTIITVDYSATKTSYSISKKVSLEQYSKSSNEAEIEVVTFDVITYESTTTEVEVNIHLQGKAHGHGHIGESHGHDNSANAGGGIVIGD